MNAPLQHNCHQIARAEIDAWRGRCIDHFARIERAVGRCLSVVRESGTLVALKPMASQRLSDLNALIKEAPSTPKQSEAWSNAISQWDQFDGKRAFLAHGEVTVLLDCRSLWHARFDLTRYKANLPIAEQWAINRDEAEKFEESLKSCFASMSQQLGAIRKRI